MNKKIMSILLVFIMTLSLCSSFGQITYAAGGAFAFEWQIAKTIKDIIEISNRKDSENELVLHWSYNKIVNGTDAYKGKYILTYHLNNGEEIELTVDNNIDNTAVIDYKIRNLNPDGSFSGSYKQASLKAYDDTTDKIYYKYNYTNNNWTNERNENAVWKNSSVAGENPLPDSIFAPTGIRVEKAGYDGVRLSVDAGSTAVFNYDNKDIIIKLDETSENITLGINGIERGKIYDFNISCEREGAKFEKQVNIFKLVEFKATPVKDPYIIDKTKEEDKSKFPGQDPKMEVKVALPSVWDKVYEFTNAEYEDNISKGISAVVDLKSPQTGETIQISIPNIYSADLPSITPSSATEAQIDTAFGVQRIVENQTEYYTFRLINMKPSTLYTTSTVNISPIRKSNSSGDSILQTVSCNLPEGESAYTYLKYDTETKSSGERILRITPYKVTGIYYVYQSSSEYTLDSRLIASFNYSANSSEDTIEVPVLNDGEYYYRVDFVYELGTVQSQLLKDQADKTQYLITPNLEIKNYEIITENKIVNGEVVKDQKLKLQLGWNGGDEEAIKNLLNQGPVIYTFSKTPFGPRDDRYAEFLQLSVGNENTLYELTPIGGPWDTLISYETKNSIKASPTEQNPNRKEVSFNINLEFQLIDENDLALRDEPSKIFYYPSVYYLKMKGSYINALNIDKETPFCNPVSITLDSSANTALPPPQNLTIDNITDTAFDLSWSSITDSVYGEYIKANDFTIKVPDGIGANIFLTQQNVINESDPEKQSSYFDPEKNSNMMSIDYSKIPHSFDEEKNITTIDLTNYIEDIRNNKMIRIVNVTQVEKLATQTVTLTGLDKNTIYYTAIQTVLNVISNIDNSEKQVYSDAISDILTATTKNEIPLVPPEPSEISPEMPTDFRQDTDEEQLPNKMTLAWTDVRDPESINNIRVKKEYELIRVEERLDDTILNKRNSFDDFWANDIGSSATKVGLQTISSESQPNNILIYNNSDFVLDATRTNDRYIYETKNKPKLQLIDKTVMPNKLYYYYIRTVRMEETTQGSNVYKEAAWSSWQPLSVTTTPVQSPVDLKVERNETYFTYNKQTEAVISFFAPIPVGTTTQQIASLYPLEYAIQEGNGEWKIVAMDVTNSSLFKNGNETKEGYQQFVYKITGLTPNKSYTVKVRMKSRVNPITESTPIYDVSLYSNTDTFRTSFDQDDYDNQEEENKWLKKYDDDVMDLSTKNYWLITNSSSTYEAIYRTKTFDGELQKAVTGSYSFEANNQPNQIYYIPAGSINLSDSYNIGYKASKSNKDNKGNMDVYIKPNSFDGSSSEDFLNALSKFNDSSNKDYYIKIELNWNNTNEAINNSAILSEVVQVKISLAGVNEVEKKLDDKFVQMFKDAIADSTDIKAKVRNELKKDLEREIKSGATDEELYQLVTDAVNEVYEDLIDDIGDEFDKSVKNTYSINTLGQSIRITFTPDNTNGETTVNGYRRNNADWENVPTQDYGNAKGFETPILGVFAFSGITVNIPDIKGIPNSTAVKQLIAKYSLTDYLGKDIIDSDAYATRYQVIGCIARMAGNSQTQNEIAFLKNKGINAVSGNLYGNISNQETVYLIMSLYEVRTNTKIETVRITNYNAMPNLNQASQQYKKSLQVATELGICDDPSILPKDNISIRDLLKYLSNLNSKLNRL